MTPMEISCDDVNARLLDLVYREGTTDERTVLEAHVGGCARCKADLAALGRTRALARQQLDDDEPPPSVHARIMKAAAEAVAAPAAAAVPAAARAVQPKPRADEARERQGLWAWLRARWTLPTFATAGAVAIFIIASRVFMNPQATYERGREQAASPPALAQPTAAVAPPPAEAPAPGGERELGRDDSRPRGWKDPFGGAKGMLEQPAAEPAPAEAPPAHPTAAAAHRKVATMRAYAAPPKPAPAPLMKDEKRMGPPPPAAAARALQATGGFDAQANAVGGTGVPAASEAPRGKAARRSKKAEAADDTLEAPAPSTPMMDADEGESQKPEKSAADKYKAPIAAPTVEALIRRADQLYAEHRWEEAAAAYEDLLRRFPGAEGVARWRTRVASARRAATPVEASKAAAAEPAASPPPPAAAAPRASRRAADSAEAATKQ
jgi:hypothetical protein